MTATPKVVQPKTNFEIREDGETLSVSIRTRSTGRFSLGVIFAFIAFCVLVMTTIAYDNGTLMLTCFALIIGFMWYGLRKSKQSVVFDEDGVTKGRKKYLYADISQLGFGTGEELLLLERNATTTGYMAGRALAGTPLWIQHGSRYITLFEALSETDARMIFERVTPKMSGLTVS